MQERETNRRVQTDLAGSVLCLSMSNASRADVNALVIDPSGSRVSAVIA